MNKQNLIDKKKKEIEELQKQIIELEEAEKLKEFQSFKINGKEIRIYKWENEKFKDFPMPKGFDWGDYKDFIDLTNKETLEPYPICYYMKNPYEYSIKNGYALAGACLIRYGYWDSYDDFLADSNGNGRVVISREVKK